METIKFTLTGTSKMLMHSDRFANPLDEATKAHKELTSKRKKTDEDHSAIAKSEFIGSCYWSKETGFYLPGQNIEASFLAGAKLQKLGVKFKQGCMVLEDNVPMAGVKAKTPEALWNDKTHIDCRGVKVGTSKIMRYRPRFEQWSVSGSLSFNPDVLSIGDVKKAMIDAGTLIGLGDFRPRFGRYTVRFSK